MILRRDLLAAAGLRGCRGFARSRLGARSAHEIGRTRDEHHPQWNAAVAERTRRVLHRRRTDRLALSGCGTARIGGAIVTFEPGARTAWHTHPLGQTLIVTSGLGWVQVEGGAKEEIRSGDVSLVPARREALARREPGDRDESYRDRGGSRR